MPNPSCIWGYDWPRDFDIGDLPIRECGLKGVSVDWTPISNSGTVLYDKTFTSTTIIVANPTGSAVTVTLANRKTTPDEPLKTVNVAANSRIELNDDILWTDGLKATGSTNNALMIQVLGHE